MGCDIHIHTELKINSEWILLHAEPWSRRNYDLFGLIADCGRGGEALFGPNRGIPEDASVGTRVCYEFDSWHSATWLAIGEVEAVLKAAVERCVLDEVWIGEFVGEAAYFMHTEDGHPLRCVIWFDN